MRLTEKELKRRLINKRKIVREKLDILKHGEIVREKLFAPTTKHLKDIEKTLNDTVKRIKPKKQSSSSIQEFESSAKLKGKTAPIKEVVLTSNNETNQTWFTPPSQQKENKRNINDDVEVDLSARKISLLKDLPDDEDDSVEEDGNILPATSTNTFQLTDLAQHSLLNYLEQSEALPRKYITEMYNDRENKIFDHKYGARFEGDRLIVGDSELHVDGSNIIVKNKKFQGTYDLYE